MIMLSKVEAKVPSQAPQGDSWPPAIGSEISTNMEWLPVKPSLQ